jgi:hypothetical protein
MSIGKCHDQRIGQIVRHGGKFLFWNKWQIMHFMVKVGHKSATRVNWFGAKHLPTHQGHLWLWEIDRCLAIIVAKLRPSKLATNCQVSNSYDSYAHIPVLFPEVPSIQAFRADITYWSHISLILALSRHASLNLIFFWFLSVILWDAANRRRWAFFCAQLA